jgi:catechol 2,3-dioxygenase-like lactoylglutathione lyase family enzyme
MQEMDALLTQFEQGKLSRRQLLQALTLAAAPRAAQPSESLLRGRTLNHVNLQIADVEQSEAYYRKLFGLPPKRAVPDRPFALDLADGSFLSLQRSDSPGSVNHFCVGVDDFSPEQVATTLKMGGLDNGRRRRPDSVYVRDPDNISVQISAPDWKG